MEIWNPLLLHVYWIGKRKCPCHNFVLSLDFPSFILFFCHITSPKTHQHLRSEWVGSKKETKKEDHKEDTEKMWLTWLKINYCYAIYNATASLHQFLQSVASLDGFPLCYSFYNILSFFYSSGRKSSLSARNDKWILMPSARESGMRMRTKNQP